IGAHIPTSVHWTKVDARRASAAPAPEHWTATSTVHPSGMSLAPPSWMLPRTPLGGGGGNNARGGRSMDAIDMLTKDHNKVRELFRQFNGGGGLTGLIRRTVGDVTAAQRRRAVDQACRELEIHTRIEEDIFYPAVKALDDE